MGDETANTISTREYMDVMFRNFEKSMSDQLGNIRKDIELFQTNHVTRAEFDSVKEGWNRDIIRIDERHKDNRDSDRKLLTDFKDDLKDSRTRTVTIVAIVCGLITGIVQIGIAFI